MSRRERPRIAFLDYPDVFEDFYPHYGVDQHQFATTWDNTGSHQFTQMLQQSAGDVTWYEFSLSPQLRDAVHEKTGCKVRYVRSSFLHRWLWKSYYNTSLCWRYQSLYRSYGLAATYTANLSADFWNALRHEPPDVFFVQDYAHGRFDIAIALGRIFKIPVVTWHAGSQPGNYFGRSIRGITLRRAARLIASSRGEAQMLQSRFGVRADRIDIILVPIDLEVYAPMDQAACRRKIGLPADTNVLLFVGRFDDKVKRISGIVDAAAELVRTGVDLQLVLVGDGEDRAPIKAYAAAKLGERVRFCGWVTDAAVKATYYNAADALLLPSMREGFPAVIGESMSCGTLVVGSNVGGIPEVVVDGQTGFLIPPGDSSALAASCKHLFEDRQLLRSMRTACRTLAEARLDKRVVAEQLRECFRQAGTPYVT